MRLTRQRGLKTKRDRSRMLHNINKWDLRLQYMVGAIENKLLAHESAILELIDQKIIDNVN